MNSVKLLTKYVLHITQPEYTKGVYMEEELEETQDNLRWMLRDGCNVQDLANALIHVDDDLTYAIKAQLGLVEILQPTVEK